MKKLVSIFLCLIMLFSFSACSEKPENTGTESKNIIDYKNYTYTKPDTDLSASGNLLGNVTWELYSDGSLYIEGEGDMPDWARISDLAWRDKLHEIKRVYIGKGITSVGDFAFAYCSNLTAVYIPDTATSVGNSSFIRCERLTDIALPSTVTEIGDSAFAYCLVLKSIIIPEELTSVGNYAFSSCIAMEEIKIHSNVSYIGIGCFTGWTEEQKITVSNSESYISKNWDKDWATDCSALVHVNQE